MAKEFVMRKILMMCAVAGTTMTGQAGAQTSLIGFTGAGEMIEIDIATGEGTLIADLGMPIVGATTTAARSVWALRADGAIIGTDPITGTWGVAMRPSGLPAGYQPVAIDMLWHEHSYPSSVNILVRPPTGPDELYHLDIGAREYELVGACGVTGLVGLSGLSLAITADAEMYHVDTRTGEATHQHSYPEIPSVGSIEFDNLKYSNGESAYVAGSSVWEFMLYPPLTASAISSPGFDPLAGLALKPPNPLCFDYADCDGHSVSSYIPDIFDFLCWQGAFIQQDPYACDCDVSTGFYVCDVFDFLCYQDAFVRASGTCP